ncbi:MAG TPA: DUF294 nucleotidyltransferase-like domain-containing protein [Anaeromyxobacter sp.]|nr:DUF294 nucleotidyltransferase-like domain-containing protein [Anaeromyxobacter sp.]
MEVELLEIRDFLAGVPPFDALPAEALERLPRSLSIRYLRRGSPFPPAGADGPALYVVRQGAIELRSDRDEVVAKYGEGDLHAAACVDDPEARGLTGFAVEDTLLYLVPCAAVADLRAAHPAFDQHFSRSLRDKLRRSLDALQSSPALGGGLLAVDVGSLVSAPPIHVAPETAIREAAQTMTARRVSSLLVMRGEKLEGIVTDRDLRRRCLAEGIPAERPVGEVMTPRVQVIAPDVPAFEALLAMTQLGVHHLPVVDRGRVLGMVTTTDLVRHQGATTVYLVGAIRRSGSVAELAQATARVPEMQVQMVAAGATPRHLGQAVGAVVDALTRRLLQLAEAELGPPPCPYAWLAFGSQARHEQTVLSDQDNGLVLSDEGTGHDAWFERLARFVNDGLHACGFPRCPGDVMASNPMWRQPLRGWRHRIDGWIERPEAKALMRASLFFDLRAAAGEEHLAVALQDHVVARLRSNEVVLALLTANALRNVPPLGFFRGFVLVRGNEHADTLDLKRGGMMPIVELARIHALAAGSTALGTVQRLREAAERRTLSRGGAEDLEDALAFVSTLRARHQAEQIKRGLPPDNHVRPDELSPLERSQLKDAFAVIRRQQEALAQVYRARSFV